MKKFRDNLSSAVITTKFIITEGSPILFVYHFLDGTWQFSGLDIVENEKDYLVLSLEEMIQLDSSIIDVADLKEGYFASREKQGDSWEIKENLDDTPETY